VASLRLLHVITSLDQGGSEGYLRRLAPALVEQGISQQVVSMVSGGFHASGLRGDGITVNELGMPRGMPDPRGLWNLRNAIIGFRPDIVQGWLYHANLLSFAASWLIPRRRRPRLSWGIRSAEMDQSRYGFGLKFAVSASARLSPYVDRIVANSEAGRADHVRLGFCADRFDVIANGIDTHRFRPDAVSRSAVRAELGLADDALLAGVFARNDPMKNLDHIVRAVTQVDGLHTVFAGVDTDQMSPAENCAFVGARSDVPRLMAACDFTILASKSEGFPNVVAESMSCGVPVIAADVGDVALILGSCGLVVMPEDWGALLAALRDFAARPQQELERLGKAGRSRIATQFSLERSVKNYVDLYAGMA